MRCARAGHRIVLEVTNVRQFQNVPPFFGFSQDYTGAGAVTLESDTRLTRAAPVTR